MNLSEGEKMALNQYSSYNLLSFIVIVVSFERKYSETTRYQHFRDTLTILYMDLFKIHVYSHRFNGFYSTGVALLAF